MLAPTSPPKAAPAAKNGLSAGVVPSSFKRRTTPVRWALSGSGAKLVVRYAGPKRAVGKVLQLATPSVIADKNVKLAIGSEPDYATIMIAALDRIGGILLKRVEPDDIPIQRQSRTVPNEAVHSVSEQRSLAEHRSIVAGCALRPV